MSFVSQSNTSYSEVSPRAPRPRDRVRTSIVRTDPRSKSRSSTTAPVAESDWSTRGSGSPRPTPEQGPLSQLLIGDWNEYTWSFASLETTTTELCSTARPSNTIDGRFAISTPDYEWHNFLWFRYEDSYANWFRPHAINIFCSPCISPTPMATHRESLRLDTVACTTRKVESSRNEEQLSYQNLEEPKRHQTLMRGEKRTYQGIRNRHEIPRAPSKFLKVQTVNDMILELSLIHSPETEIGGEWSASHGRSSLKFWRRTAGRSKSWKRCPRSMEPSQTHQKQVRRCLDLFEHRFSKSPLWIPLAFLRSHSPRRSCVVQCQGLDPIPKQVKRYANHTDGFEDVPVTIHRRYRTTAKAQDPGIRESGPLMIEDITREPAGAFMRFTWKDKVLTNGLGQLDRFLPAGLVFRSGWCITGFSRNDSFADVYSLSKASSVHSSATTDMSWEAHIFLDEYHGNCAIYARRLKIRMQQIGACLDTFWYGGRHVVIIEIRRKPDQFRLRNTEEEFPVLVDQNKCNERVALQRRRFRGKPSFAAAAGVRGLDVGFDRGSTPMPGQNSALQKELEQIEKARLKKAQKQRVKRQSQRIRRIANRQQSIEEAVDKRNCGHRRCQSAEP